MKKKTLINIFNISSTANLILNLKSLAVIFVRNINNTEYMHAYIKITLNTQAKLQWN